MKRELFLHLPFIFLIMKKNKVFLLLSFIWFAFTTFLLCLPGGNFPKILWLRYIPQFDKLVHIFIFFVLSFLICKTVNNKKWFLQVALCCSFYGVIMEFVQKYYIPNRSFDLVDIVADTIGSFFVLIAAKYLPKIF